MFTKLLISLISFSIFTAQTIASNTHYVNTKTLKVRLAPTSKADHLYSIYKGHKVRVYEIKDDWARISEYTKTAKWVHKDYLTKLKDTKPQKKITETKVIEEPIVAEEKEKEIEIEKVEDKKIEEVEEKTLLEEAAPQVILPQPELPEPEIIIDDTSMNDVLLETIAKSDDFKRYESTFTSVSQRLFKDGTCQLKDFKRSNGWMEISDGELYFIYCGKIKKQNKIFLNVITGETFKKAY